MKEPVRGGNRRGGREGFACAGDGQDAAGVWKRERNLSAAGAVGAGERRADDYAACAHEKPVLRRPRRLERHREAQAARVHPRGRQRRRDLLAGTRCGCAEETGCDGVAVGRAAQGNPWIFRQIADAMAGKAAVEPTNEESLTCSGGICTLAQLKGEAIAVREMRRHIVCYVCGMRDAARLRVRVNAITDIGEMESALRAFMLEGRVYGKKPGTIQDRSGFCYGERNEERANQAAVFSA